MDWVGHFWNVSVGSGNGAKNILGIAQQNHWQISTMPTVGSIAVYQPGTFQLASGSPFYVGSAGHAAIVTDVGQGGLYTMSEMNGISGYGNVDQQTFKPGGSVAFVTPPSNLAVNGGTNIEDLVGGNAMLTSATSGIQGFNGTTGCKTLGEAVSGGIPFVSGASGFVGWIAQGCVWKRILIYMVSGGLIIFGLKYMGVEGPSRVVTEPARAYGKVVGTGAKAAVAA